MPARRKAWLFCVLIFILWMTGNVFNLYVVPHYEALFSGAGAQLPSSTMIIIHLSHFFRTTLGMLLSLFIAGSLGGVYFLFHSRMARLIYAVAVILAYCGWLAFAFYALSLPYFKMVTIIHK